MVKNAAAADTTVRKLRYLPREHGATAMLLTPIVCAGILARTWHWSELATLTAAFAALAAKDPLVVLFRQRFIWKQKHAETGTATRWFAFWSVLFCGSGLILLYRWPWKMLAGMGSGLVAYSVVAVAVNVKNKQRSTLFQLASAAALTSSSLACAISATGTIPDWCWWLWALLAMHATLGILVVHARLDARIALRSPSTTAKQSRRTALTALTLLACALVAAGIARQTWIALALAVATVGFGYDLARQRNITNLQMPLMKVGRRALALALVFAVLVIVGLW